MSVTAEVAVVGLGMFGAAAAKYLAEEGQHVVAVGPGEPNEADDASQHEFASHYDQGRICRRLGWDPVWAYLDAVSLDRFRPMEERSGVTFFHDRGSLILLATSIASRTDTIVRQADDAGVPVDRMSAHELTQEFPMLALPPLASGVEGLLERDGAGLLDPRGLVQAQVKLAAAAGAEVIRGAVVGAEKHDGRWHLRVDNGAEGVQEIQAQKILVTTGALTNYGHVLPGPLHVAMHAYTEPNLLFEVDPTRDAELWKLPPVVTVDPDDTGEDNRSTYLIPPVLYPDGKHYVRIGPGMQPFVARLDTLADTIAWYQRQRVTDVQGRFLTAAIGELLPTLRTDHPRHATCIVAKTVTGYPYIGALGDDSLFVAVGGNGHGARGSDEIGRLASQAVMGKTPDFPLPDDTFAPVTASDPRAVWEDSSRLKPPFGLC